eukprot:1498707-Amphidinium_carterae.1
MDSDVGSVACSLHTSSKFKYLSPPHGQTELGFTLWGGNRTGTLPTPPTQLVLGARGNRRSRS